MFKDLLLIGFITMVANANALAKSVEQDAKEVATVLDQFHVAASKADGEKYFGAFAPEGIFIGTDASERWTVGQFKEYAAPFFSKGKGWTYQSIRRSIDFSPSGDVAWFDEILENASYGTCRGSGVLRRIGNDWKIAQYHLTIPVPNDLADDLVKMIRKNHRHQ